MIVADFHVHSPYSRATSKDMSLPVMALWAGRKGIHLLGTGDATHPVQVERIREQLEEAEEGLFRLRPGLRPDEWLPAGAPLETRFCLTGEISSIYKRAGKVRKVHNLVVLSGLPGLERFRERLGRLGNLVSDGRPILGLDARELLALLLETDPAGWLVPAHIWTPWFSVLGSRSGFDSIEECFGDLAEHVFALETGLSSDPPMNDRVSALDRFRLISCSDAHSAPNLMRNATLFDGPLALPALRQALAAGDPERHLGTLELFPEEGKYHLDGHRKCGVRLEPEETRALGGLCPVCGQPVTVGVLARVVELADRSREQVGRGLRPFRRFIPLPEVLGAARGVGPGSAGVQALYRRLLEELGPEWTVAMDAPLERIAALAGPVAAEGIRRVRLGEVAWEPGFDGEYGKPLLFGRGERDALARDSLFGPAAGEAPGLPGLRPRRRTAPSARRPAQLVADRAPSAAAAPEDPERLPWLAGLDADQRAAATAPPGPLLIEAPPGSGKTRTLVARVAHRILGLGTDPARIVVLTFTRRAAQELQERLAAVPGLGERAKALRAGTIHALCFALLAVRWEGTPRRITGRLEAERLLKTAAAAAGLDWESRAAEAFFRLRLSGRPVPEEFGPLGAAFEAELASRGRLDLDGLVLAALALLETPGGAEALRVRPDFLAVDEYQDVDPAQARLLDLLAGPGGDLTAIGDPGQAIYAFRGADPGLFDSFPARHPGTLRIGLKTCYRSTRLLVAAAGALAGAEIQPARSAPGVPIVRLRAEDEAAEAAFVAAEIETLLGGVSHFSLDASRSAGHVSEYGFKDIGVLYRTRRQEGPLEEALSRAGIPFQKAGEEEALARGGLNRLAASLRLALGQADDLDLEALLAEPGRASAWHAVRRMAEAARRRGLALADAVESHRLVSGIDAPARDGLERLALALPRWRRLAGEAPAALLEELLAGPPGASLDPELGKALRARAQEGLQPLADRLATGSLPDLMGLGLERVVLSTVHGAKGLEFPLVFLVGLEQGLFPPEPGPGRPVDLEEERRLFYVGLTRAADRLYLTHAARRTVRGGVEPRSPSPFLELLPAALVEERLPAVRHKPRPRRERGLFGEL